jgi:hypothetical protein
VGLQETAVIKYGKEFGKENRLQLIRSGQSCRLEQERGGKLEMLPFGAVISRLIDSL